MKIRITDEQLVKQMDEVIKEEGFTSRNQFITYVISMYLASENKFFLRAFPPVMREICKGSIDEQKKNAEHLLQKNEILMIYVRYSTLRSPKKKPNKMMKNIEFKVLFFCFSERK